MAPSKEQQRSLQSYGIYSIVSFLFADIFFVVRTFECFVIVGFYNTALLNC